MKKLSVILIVIALLSVTLCSCTHQNLGSGSDVQSSVTSTKTESDVQAHSSDTTTSAEKEETSSYSQDKPTTSQKPSGNIGSTSSKDKTPTKPQTSSVPSTPIYPEINPSTEDFKKITPISPEDYYGWQYIKSNGTESEQKAYKAFLQAFSRNEKTVNFDFKINSEAVQKVYEIYMADYPEQFFLGRASYTTDSRDNVISFTVKSDMASLSQTELAAIKKTVQDKAYNIILELFPDGVYKNEIETVRAVHDYLVNNIKYDKTHSLEHSYDMYGALINGSSVCEGYAESFLYIMRLCGIECILVNGTMSDISHVWNMVKLDGQWYHIDVTSDDPILKSGEQVTRFEYFNLTDAEIQLTHTIEENLVDIPKATATKYNFFKYYGLEYSVLDNDVFIASMSFSMRNGYDSAYFKFTNNTPSQAVDYYLKNAKTISEIVNNNKFNKKIESGGSVSYSQSKQKNILNLELRYK